MTAVVLTPFTRSTAEQAGGRLWRKKILPVGKINYKQPDGSVRVIEFSKDYNDQLARAFNDRAYDQVPFQLAPDDNRHTNDVERYGGTWVQMDSEADGLYAILSPTSRGEAIIKENPALGVSARIVEGYARADGKFYNAAIQHVLGTLDPRITGLGAWETIEASNTADVVIDLTGEIFAGERGAGVMPELTPEQTARLAKLLDIPDDKWESIVAGLGSGLSDADLDRLAGEGEGAEGELTDAELEELLAAAEEIDRSGAGAPAGAMLSSEAAMAIELANARAEGLEQVVSGIQRRLDGSTFAAERRHFVTDLGLTPHTVDLARPLLEGAGHAIELSNGTRVDAGQIMRQVLESVARTHSVLDLGIELGTAMDEPDGAGAQARADARADVIGRFKSQTGIA